MVAGSVIAPTVKLGGAIVIAVRLMLEVPVLLIVNVCDELVEPTAWLGKLNVVGLMLTVAVLVRPVPVSGTLNVVLSCKVRMKLQL